MKVLKTIGKVLATIVGCIFGIAGAICLLPFVLLALLICIPAEIFQDIWEQEW